MVAQSRKVQSVLRNLHARRIQDPTMHSKVKKLGIFETSKLYHVIQGRKIGKNKILNQFKSKGESFNGKDLYKEIREQYKD